MRLLSSSILLSVMVVSFQVSPGSATITFSRTSISVSGGPSDAPQAVALADLNKDRKPDMLMVDNTDDTVLVFLNAGDGTFGDPTSFDTDLGPVAVATGDFNRDGSVDMVVVNGDDASVTVRFGDGTGNFGDPQRVDVNANPVGVAVGDLDGDRVDDLAVLGNDDDDNGTIYLLKSNGDGTFSPFTIPQLQTRGMESFAIAAGFLDNNATLDLVVSNNFDDTLSVFTGNGNGTFRARVPFVVATSPAGLAIADLNGDAFEDIAVVTGVDVDAGVSLLYGNGDGTFQAEVRTTAEIASIGLAVADWDSDGKNDFAVSNTSGGTGLELLCQQPSDVCVDSGPVPNPIENGFQLQPPGRGLVFGDSVSVATADLNGDGKPDLVGMNADGDSLGVFLNTTGAVQPTTTPTVGGPTATPGSPTATVGSSGTPTPTVTPLPTATPTAIPVAPYGVCNTNDPGQPNVGGRPVALALGDFNRDGNIDVAVADAQGAKITILLTDINVTAGSASNPCPVLGLSHDPGNDVAGVSEPMAVATEDLNGDGRLDLAVVGSSGLSVFYGGDQGHFTASSQNGTMPATNLPAMAFPTSSSPRAPRGMRSRSMSVPGRGGSNLPAPFPSAAA